MTRYDLAVIGGGIMGCSAAIRAAEGGMRVVVIERAGIGSGASGVNAGTLSLQIKRVALMPYAMEGRRLWEEAGDLVGFRRTGGLTVAFNEREAAMLTERMTLKQAAGAPIELVSPAFVACREPSLNRRVVAASWCAEDGYANSSLTGVYYRNLLAASQISIVENAPVQAITTVGDGFELLSPTGKVSAGRVLFACGAWLGEAVGMLGVSLPIRVRVNTVSVTERGPPLVNFAIGHATGLLTLKQKQNGTILIGGGWQGRGAPSGAPGEVVADSLLTNINLARFAVPGLSRFRLMRSWTGFEPGVPDSYPLAGALPGFSNAFIVGCVRGGYTIGPYIGRLMGDLILGREPERPLFDPARYAPAAAKA